MLTAEELHQIQRLHLQLRRKVDSPFAGEYRSAFRGQGMEFEQVRAYVPGDDVRHIDWNVTARAGAPFIKEFREERELTLMVVMDVSGSMRVGSGGLDGRTDKRLQTARLAGALAYAAVRNHDRVGLATFTDRVEHLLPPRKAKGHAWAVIRAAFEQPPPRRGTDLAGVLEHVGRMLKRRSVITLLSDFHSVDPIDRALSGLCRRHQVSCFLVHDPLEESLAAVSGLVELEDAETGRVRLVDAGRVRPGEPLDARLRRLRRTGAQVRAISTAEDPFHALMLHFRSMELRR